MLDRHHIAELWSRMAAMYGHPWVSAHGETDADDTWWIGLRDLEPADLARGIRVTLQRAKTRATVGDEDWPPTLGEFRAFCKPPLHPSHVLYRSLPAPVLTVEERSAAIERCRQSLRGGAA